MRLQLESVVFFVADFEVALTTFLARGATLHRGPAVTDFGARVALLIDPFGNTLGLNQARPLPAA